MHKSLLITVASFIAGAAVAKIFPKLDSIAAANHSTALLDSIKSHSIEIELQNIIRESAA